MSMKLIMTLAFSTLGERAFMNRTISEIMWGYDDPLIHLINKYLPDVFPFKGKFGLFAEVSVAQQQVRGLEVGAGIGAVAGGGSDGL